VTYVTHKHLHIHTSTNAQWVVREMLDEVQS
jgi:hypothetical protein